MVTGKRRRRSADRREAERPEGRPASPARHDPAEAFAELLGVPPDEVGRMIADGRLLVDPACVFDEEPELSPAARRIAERYQHRLRVRRRGPSAPDSVADPAPVPPAGQRYEMCSIGPDGTISDAELWEEMLTAEGDARIAEQAIRRAIARGLDPEMARLLYGIGGSVAEPADPPRSTSTRLPRPRKSPRKP